MRRTQAALRPNDSVDDVIALRVVRFQATRLSLPGPTCDVARAKSGQSSVVYAFQQAFARRCANRTLLVRQRRAHTSAANCVCPLSYQALLVRAVQIEQIDRHAVGPPEAVLQRIFASASATGSRAFYHVLLDQLLIGRINALYVRQKPRADLLRERIQSVTLQTFDRDPVQRRPAIRRVPLLCRVVRGRHEPSRLQQRRLHLVGRLLRAFRPCCTFEQRIQHRRGFVVPQLPELPVVVP
jgi:hypothetical protein